MAQQVQKYTKEDFQSYVKEKKEQALDLLKKDMEFTEEGLAKFLKDKVKGPLCIEAFGEILGKPFDPENAAHMTELLEKVYTDDEAMVFALIFGYEKLAEEEAAGKGKGKGRTKKTGTGRVKTNWREQEIPFGEKSSQAVVFKALVKHVEAGGTRREFTKVAQEALDVSDDHKSVKASGLIGHLFSNLRKRGWTVAVKEDQTIKLERPAAA